MSAVLKFLPAVAALAASVNAQGSRSCSTSTLTVSEAAQATNIDCSIMDTIVVSSDIEGELVIDGPHTLTGGLRVVNASGLNALSSSSLRQINGTFELSDVQNLQRLEMTQLATIRSMRWIGLPSLSSLTLGTAGITSAETVIIENTDIQSLDGLNLGSVDEMVISNNPQLRSYSSQLGNVSRSLTIGSNGDELNITLPNLVWGNRLVFNDAQHIELPSLSVVNTTLQFNNNTMTEFAAPNLTRIGDNDIVFLNNVELANISLPLLEEVGGSVRIVNNTEIEEISLPELREVGGAIEFGGNFTEVDMPELEVVRGAFTVLSTGDISDACDTYDDMEGSEIRGEYRCESENENANEGENSTSSGGGGSGNGDDDGAAGIIGANMATLVSVGLLGALVQFIL